MYFYIIAVLTVLLLLAVFGKRLKQELTVCFRIEPVARFRPGTRRVIDRGLPDDVDGQDGAGDAVRLERVRALQQERVDRRQRASRLHGQL